MTTQSQLNALRWYETQANHGRGRITGESKKLLDRGLLKLTHTGVYTWVLAISDEGRVVIAKAKNDRRY